MSSSSVSDSGTLMLMSTKSGKGCIASIDGLDCVASFGATSVSSPESRSSWSSVLQVVSLTALLGNLSSLRQTGDAGLKAV